MHFQLLPRLVFEEERNSFRIFKVELGKKLLHPSDHLIARLDRFDDLLPILWELESLEANCACCIACVRHGMFSLNDIVARNSPGKLPYADRSVRLREVNSELRARRK